MPERAESSNGDHFNINALATQGIFIRELRPVEETLANGHNIPPRLEGEDAVPALKNPRYGGIRSGGGQALLGGSDT